MSGAVSLERVRITITVHEVTTYAASVPNWQVALVALGPPILLALLWAARVRRSGGDPSDRCRAGAAVVGCCGTDGSAQDEVPTPDPRLMRRPFRFVLLGALLVAGTHVALAQPTPPTAMRPGAIWALTWLKANPGAVDDLTEAIRRNWFALDARAVAGGHLVSYQLLRGTPADTTWDLLEITMYADSLQHARVDSIYRALYRPSHVPVLVNGKRWQEYGRIVRSETTRWVDGGPPTRTPR
jgi:hypothetical protein